MGFLKIMPPNQHDIIVTDADVRQSEEKSSTESPTKIIVSCLIFRAWIFIWFHSHVREMFTDF